VEPIAERPDIERSYGIPESPEGMLSFDHVRDRMDRSRTYWLTTVRADGRPHAVPVWGVWLDDRMHFGGGGTTRKARNLARNPAVVLHTESGEDVVILEGTAVEVTDPGRQRFIDDAYEAKYGIRHGTPVWELRPAVAFAWTEYPKTVTRWRFSDGG
jgi:Pyridoxamine 5'-phosphate oxidase